MATLNVKSLPDELYERLRMRARKRHRSISQEIIHILSRTLADSPELSILVLKGLGKEEWEGASGDEHVRAERDSWD